MAGETNEGSVHKMNTTIKNLTNWIESLKKSAAEDDAFAISWFGETKNDLFCIVGGWQDGYDIEDEYLCKSKSQPTYAMCVKIAVNDGQYCPDFDTMMMPIAPDGTVDDTCISLEQEDDAESLAKFLLHELERITETYSEFYEGEI